MNNTGRRQFIKGFFPGMGGGYLLFKNTRQEPDSSSNRSFGKIGGSRDQSWEKIKNNFPLQKGLYYFNNGSLGPSPEPVISATRKYRAILDSFPSKYMWGGWKKEKEEVRQKTATLLKVSQEEIALIHNTTEGMNLVAASLKLKAGDEVIVANHEHPSGTIPWKYWQETKGIKLIRPKLPLLPQDPRQIVDIYQKAITNKTRVISMCHIVNTNGMILPVKEVSEIAHQKGILVVVDGAQSVGMLDINLSDLGCDFYAASSHKWLFSPKGMGIFYAKKSSQHLISPLIVAAGYKDKSIRRFENYNTRNLPELLGLGAAIDYINQISQPEIENRIFNLKKYFLTKLKARPYLKLKTPLSDSLSGGIQTVTVKNRKALEVSRLLMNKFSINCRPMFTHGLNGLRISLAIYISLADIDYLFESFDWLSGE